MPRLTRRAVLRAGATLAASSGLAPLAGAFTARSARAQGAAEALQLACIGVGGMGWSDLNSLASGPGVRIAAVCDVDAGRLAQAAGAFEGARAFTDWRRLLDELGEDLDAVSVSTPDHMHAPIALAAMERGLHVYVQKPLAHDLAELRALERAAAARGVVTQMGTQIHGDSAYRTAIAALRAGALGEVREVHSWVSKSWAGPAAGRRAGEDPVPEGLAWDLWLGVAPARPFVAGAYHPASWRGWRDFGTGTLGDMGCHLLEPLFNGLGLGAPTHVVSRGPAHRAETYAPDGDVTWTFGAAGGEPLTLRWTDGSGASRPDAARAALPEGQGLPGAGSFVVGSEATMVLPHWSMPTFHAEGEAVALADLGLEPAAGGNHYHEWTDACRGEGTTGVPFEVAVPITSTVLAGVVAGCFPDRQLAWDAAGLEFDDEAATALVAREYREGWR